MTRFAILSISAAAVLPALLPIAPAVAQGTRVNEIIVYGTDPCPRSTDDDVVVCARKPEAERYRIPETLREGGSLQSRTNWAERATAIETHSRTGVNSCSPVGPAGHTGCLEQLTRQAFKERREQNSSDTAPDE
jgi:hypothetical protein